MRRYSKIDKKWHKSLLPAIETVPLKTRHSKTVFYHSDVGKKRAKAFCNMNSAFIIDILLDETPMGRHLLQRLGEIQKCSGFKAVEESWWTLSRRLAENATGDVWAFGDREIFDDVEHYRSKHQGSKHKFVDTVFEKIELPVLEANTFVSKIFYNGRLID